MASNPYGLALDETRVCEDCGGSGEIEEMEQDMDNFGLFFRSGRSIECPTCNGWGRRPAPDG